MQFIAKAKYIRYSPYKLRPLVDVIRGKDAQYALNWFEAYPTRKIVPIVKVLKSAVSNAKHLKNVPTTDLLIKEIRVDQGPIFRYFKPGAMGRANLKRKRFSHISVTLESKEA